MTDSVDSGQDGSDAFCDPFCEPCCEGKFSIIAVYGYCDECCQYLCSDCHATHSKLQATKGHVIKTGADMPQSMAAKPVKYGACNIHPGLVKDLFCSAHKRLICSLCSSTDHKECFVSSVVDVCKTTNVSDIRYLCDAINEVYNNVNSVESSVARSIDRLKVQRGSLLQEALSLYDRSLSNLNAKHEKTKCEIETMYKAQLQILDGHKDKITPLSLKVEGSLKGAKLLCRTASAVDAKVFIKSQELVDAVNQFSNDIQYLNQSLIFVSLTLQPTDLISNFLTSTSSFGSVSIDKEESTPNMFVSDIIFPVAHAKRPTTFQVDLQQQRNCTDGLGETRLVRASSVDEGFAAENNCITDHERSETKLSNTHLSDTEMEKQHVKLGKPAANRQSPKASKTLANAKAFVAAFDARLKDDNVGCNITGIAVTCDGRCVIADNENGKVKMFSKCKAIRMRYQDRQYLGCVILPSKPRDVVVINDEAVVTTDNNNALVILDITSRILSYRSVKETVKLSYKARGIAKYNDKLVVTCPRDNPPCVKLIDKTGKVYWSASSDHQSQRMFYRPWYVCSGSVYATTIYVTDWDNSILLLDRETGEVTMKQKKNKKGPRGIATDANGNIYVCYKSKNEICQLQDDLFEVRKLLSFQDGLLCAPQAIVYDDIASELMVSYNSTSCVDCVALGTTDLNTVGEDGEETKQLAAQSQSPDPPILDEGMRTRQPGIIKKVFQFVDSCVTSISSGMEFSSSFIVANVFDIAECNITGTTIANDGRCLIVDNKNRIILLFSQSRRGRWFWFLQSSQLTRYKLWHLRVPYKPKDIAMINDHEAVVTTDDSSLVILDISNELLSHADIIVKKTVKLSFNAHGIAKYRNNKVLVTCPNNKPACVKLIDMTGRVYWSASSDVQGKQMFTNPLYVCSHLAGSSSSVFVTDETDNRITKLNGETGELLMTRESKRKEPRGITTDTGGNIYVCYSGSHEISCFRDDLPTVFERSLPKPGFKPQAIAFDCSDNSMIVSFGEADFVGVVKLRSVKILLICILCLLVIQFFNLLNLLMRNTK